MVCKGTKKQENAKRFYLDISEESTNFAPYNNLIGSA